MKTEHIIILILTLGLGFLFWQSQQQKKQVAVPQPTNRSNQDGSNINEYVDAATGALDKIGEMFGGW